VRFLKILFFVPTLFFVSSYSIAQDFLLKGRVLDNQKKPVKFASIVLKKDSIQAKRGITDSSGVFMIKVDKGHYILRIEQFGSKLIQQEFMLQADTNLGDILVDGSLVLATVKVIGRKDLIERKVDRLVVNVENLPGSQGTDAIGVLQNTPLVNADENNGISIVGKGSVSIMVNDRMIYLSGNELISYLKSIRSENISSVEVITTPPAKYDAQGNGGIINIVLKKNPNLGWSGNYTASYVQATNTGYNNNFNLNYQDSKIRSSLNLRQSYSPVTAIGYNNLIGFNSVLTDYSSSNKNKLYGGSYSLDYSADKKTDIGLFLDYSHTSANRDMLYGLQYQTNNITDSILNTHSLQDNAVGIFQSNLYIGRQLKNKGQKLEFNANFLTTDPTTTVDFITDNTTNGNATRIFTDNRLNYRVYSGQIDLTLPNSWIYVETGGKFTRFINNSELDYFNLLGTQSVLNPQNSDVFAYRESNIAGYVSASKSLSKKWNAKAGLRYEYTFTHGFSPVTGEETDTKYGRLFPTFYLSYTADNKNSFYFNYSRRISRPNFSLLNPFRNYSNPFTYYSGNPELQPSYTDNLEIGYSRNSLNITIYSSFWNNGNAYVTQFQNGIQSNIQENYISQKSVGSSVFYNGHFFNIWDVTPTANISYMTSGTSIDNTVAVNGFSANLNINNSLYLNSSKTTSFLINYNEFFGNYSGNIRNYPRGSLYAGFKTSLFERKLQMNVGVTDLLKQQYSHGKTFYTTFYQEYRNYVDARRLTVALTYTFGNNKVKSTNRNLKFDDKNRAN